MWKTVVGTDMAPRNVTAGLFVIVANEMLYYFTKMLCDFSGQWEQSDRLQQALGREFLASGNITGECLEPISGQQ